MSYLTNSTANRLKINKGWKNPSFPETLPLYSRDNVFLFKLYLFLKAYFTLNKTRLIYCDLRTSENYTKILYLVINSVPKQVNKKKSFRTWYMRKTTSGLKHSKFRDANLRQAVNLLYLDLPKLKKQFSAKLLPLSKQKVNPVFYRKTRYKTWINFLAKIKNIRNNSNLYSKRKNLRFTPIVFNKLNLEQSLKFKLKRIKNEVIVLNRLFSALKSNNALTKQNLILHKTQLNALKNKLSKLVKAIAKFKLAQNTLPKSLSHISDIRSNATLRAHINKKAYLKTAIKKIVAKVHKKKIERLLVRLIESGQKRITFNNKSYTKADLEKIVNKKISKRLLRVRLITANHILNANTRISINDYKNWVQRNAISRLKFNQFLLKAKENTNTRFLSQSLNALKLDSNVMVNKRQLNTIILNDSLHKQFLYNTLSAYINYLKENNYLNTQRSFAKFTTLLNAQYAMSTRTPKRTRVLTSFIKNFSFNENQTASAVNYPTHLKSVTNIRSKRARRGGKSKFTFALLKNLRNKKKLEKNSRTFAKSNSNFELNSKNVSYLLKHFAKRYKKLASTKLSKRNKKVNVWKLRESFRENSKRHVKILTKYQYKLGLQNVLSNYFKMNFEVKIVRPLSQFKNLKLFRLFYPLRHYFNNNNNKSALALKKNLRKALISKVNTNKTQLVGNKKEQHKTPIPLKQRYIIMGNRTKRFAKFANNKLTYTKRNTYISKKEADIFQRIRREELLEVTKENLHSVQRRLMAVTFAPIASLFIKYLNPQILADHIAKELEKSKRHLDVIYSLEETLSALPFARAKGYHISIAGRLNSADKTRSYFFRRNVLSRQNFSSKVNYASAQARARIGAFGIQVWIFY